MLGTGFELQQHTLFSPLSAMAFPIIPSASASASAISFSQFQTKNNAGKEATESKSIIQNSKVSVSVNKRRHSKSYLERQSAILQLQQASSQSHFDSALARYFILFNSSFFFVFFFSSKVIKRHIIWVLLLMPT